MKLRRVEVRDFRKIKGPLVLPEIGDGLTIVAGDNEEGKSSLLAALKAAFFDLHTLTGAARQAMTPWASDAVPVVLVEFEVDGKRWALQKAFRRGGCTLTGPTIKLEGDAAERRLQELLRFERPGRGPSGPSHQGLASLFWVEQGTAIANLQPVGDVKDRLGAIIAGEVGGVGDGRHGRQIAEKVSAEAAKFWTPSSGRERGPLTEAREKVERLRQEDHEVQQRITLVRSKVDRLASLRGQQRQRALRDDIGRARDRLQAVRVRMAGIERLEGTRAEAIERVKAAEAEVSRLAAQQRSRTMLLEELARLEAERCKLTSELDGIAQERALAETTLATAILAERRTADALASATADLQCLMRHRAYLEASRQAARLRDGLERARELEQELRQRRVDLVSYRITPAAMTAIRQAADARSVARAALEVAATRIELYPEDGRAATVDGRPVEAGRAIVLTERAQLTLGGFGRMVVLPGGQDLATRQAQLADAERRLAEVLASVGAAEAAEAEVLLEQRKRCEAAIDGARKVLEAVLAAEAAPSLAALEERLAGMEQELAQQRNDLDPVGSEPRQVDQEAVGRAERLVGQRREEARAGRQFLSEAEQRVAAIARRAAELEGRITAQSQALARAAERLHRDRLEQPDTAIVKALSDAADRRLTMSGALEQVERELRLADAERVREELAQAIKTLTATESDAVEFDRRLREAEVEARTLGSEELGERSATVRAELALAERTLERLLLEARAWRMLKEEIQAQEKELRSTWTAPVRERLLPLLSRVLPGASPTVDPAAMSLSHLERHSLEEPFESLSLGTREQISILVRIALAQLVAAREGEAPCLVLDDALVYADEGRLEAMKAVIERASAELQILLLTCRPRDYLGLEARRLRLQDCAVGD